MFIRLYKKVYDHGPTYCAHLLKEEGNSIILYIDKFIDLLNFHLGLCCVFSGPAKTADDIIASAVKWCQTNEYNAFLVVSFFFFNKIN